MIPTIEQLATIHPEQVTERLLREPVSQWFERKSSRIKGHELAKTLVAMANADGGTVVIGLSDGACEGVLGFWKAQNSWYQAGLDFTEPPVHFDVTLLDCVNSSGAADRLFAISVLPTGQMHANHRDEVFQRVGDEDRRLSFDQRIQLRYDRGDTSFELTPAATFGHARLDDDEVAAYVARFDQTDPQRLLRARGLVDSDGAPLTAGQLLLGEEPQRAFPAAYVRVLRYEGTARRTGTAQNLLSDVRCEGTLPQQIDAAQQEIRRSLPRRRSLGPDGRFHWQGIVPEEVWLEALVNAVIHRAYSNFGDHIRAAIFDDRLEVASPGRFPGVTRFDDLTNIGHNARNPRIARVMAQLSYGQELGEGLKRMVGVMEAAGLRRPSVEHTGRGVEVTLSGTKARPLALSNITPIAVQIFDRLGNAGQLRTGEIVELTGFSRPTVLKHLYALEERRLVRRVGGAPADPTAYWTVEVEFETPAT